MIVHKSVMAKEVLDYLVPTTEIPVYLDCTTGEGGHTSLFLEKYSSLQAIGLDRDADIQKKAIDRLSCFAPRFTPVNTWFDEYLAEAKTASVDLILIDLGISIFHYVESNRGFSFRNEEKLDMRLDLNQSYSAYNIVNEYCEEDIANIIFKYGEERYSRRIAKKIVEEREVKKIESSKELADIIFHAVPKDYRYGKIHPATRSFQALRIETNSELDRISPALENAIRVLKPNGRLAVITFHSLEDRIVKWLFKDFDKNNPGQIKILTKRPIIATEEELKDNPPSRSAKLRVIEKLEVNV